MMKYISLIAILINSSLIYASNVEVYGASKATIYKNIVSSNDLDIYPSWKISKSDLKISLALKKWADKAGWKLIWSVDKDFDINVDAEFKVDIISAISKLLYCLKDSDFPLQAHIYKDNKVIRITKYTDSHEKL